MNQGYHHKTSIKGRRKCKATWSGAWQGEDHQVNHNCVWIEQT